MGGDLTVWPTDRGPSSSGAASTGHAAWGGLGSRVPVAKLMISRYFRCLLAQSRTISTAPGSLRIGCPCAVILLGHVRHISDGSSLVFFGFYGLGLPLAVRKRDFSMRHAVGRQNGQVRDPLFEGPFGRLQSGTRFFGINAKYLCAMGATPKT